MTVEIRQECLVVGAYSQRMLLQFEQHGQVEARIKGKKLRPVCGDRVIAEPILNEPEWLITSICARNNELSRPDNRGRKEILAANLDCIVAMAAVEPTPDWYIIDRYLAAAEIMGANGVVALNKTDLRQPDTQMREILEDYVRIGYRVILCSADSGENLDKLRSAMFRQTAIIVGQSGVGKSSVINQIVQHEQQRTASLSASSGEGRHTTVNSVLLPLENGGAVIDSPGVRDYAPAIEDPHDVNHGFVEIRDSAQRCRFANCIHLREPKCAVKQDVATGNISERRYESYKRLMNTTTKLAEKFGTPGSP